jgi:hypothetical protein
MLAGIASLSALLLASPQALALPLPEGALEQRCWQQFTRERTRVNLRDPVNVEFSNLRDGHVVA